MESGAPATAVIYKWLGWFDENRQKVLFGAAVVCVIGIIVAFFIWRSGQKEQEAGQALAKAFLPQMTGHADRVEPSAFLKVASQYPKSDAAASAALLGATALFDAGKYAEAQAEFDKFARERRDSPFTAEAQLGAAASLEAQGKSSEALTAYKNLVDRRPSDAVVPQAKYAMARIYDSQEKPEQAYPLYEDVARSDSFGSLGQYAGIRAEELKAKYPKLAPTPVAPVTTSPFTLMTNAPAAALSNAAPQAPKK